MTREYKVFRGSDEQPTSEVMAPINFVPHSGDSAQAISKQHTPRVRKFLIVIVVISVELQRQGEGQATGRSGTLMSRQPSPLRWTASIERLVVRTPKSRVADAELT